MRRFKRIAVNAALAGLLAFNFAGPASAAQGKTVRVAQGELNGVSERDADAWLGVPYAEAPLGPLRWTRPLPAVTWRGVREADTLPPSCIQPLAPPEGHEPYTPEYMVRGNISEDCLYLNVWTPKNSQGRRLPVYFWIHGGGLFVGSSDVPIYDGANLAANADVIVVSVNYRLGPFGFLVHPELAKEAGTSGNYGLMDMVAALGWVKANIGAFGGDPDNVTIGGQSGGAMAVHDLIAAPSAKGLFVRAIAQSGSSITPRAEDLASATSFGEELVRAAGVGSVAELRALPADQVLKAAGNHRFGAAVDGRFLPREPTNAQFEPGAFYDTPILTGYTLDEGSSFDNDSGSWTPDRIDELLSRFGRLSDRARALYLSPSASPAETGKALSRDRSMAALGAWARRRLPSSSQPIYAYQYQHVTPGPQAARYGAFHTADVPYVFQNFLGKDRVYTADDRQASALISGYFVNFIKTGNPNGPGLPYWPAFDASDQSTIRLDTTATVSRLLPPDRQMLFEDSYALDGNTMYRFP